MVLRGGRWERAANCQNIPCISCSAQQLPRPACWAHPLPTLSLAPPLQLAVTSATTHSLPLLRVPVRTFYSLFYDCH